MVRSRVLERSLLRRLPDEADEAVTAGVVAGFFVVVGSGGGLRDGGGSNGVDGSAGSESCVR